MHWKLAWCQSGFGFARAWLRSLAHCREAFASSRTGRRLSDVFGKPPEALEGRSNPNLFARISMAGNPGQRGIVAEQRAENL